MTAGSSSSGTAAVPEEWLAGHWPCDECTGTLAGDHSDRANHGTIVGAEWGERGGVPALVFPGNGSRVEVADAAAFELERDLTIAVALWKDRANAAERWDAILAKSPMAWAPRATTGEAWLAFEAAHAPVWDYELLTSMARSDEPAFFSNNGTPGEVYGGVAVPVGGWHHVAVTRAGENVAFYLDGTCTARARMDGDYRRSGGPLLIGSDGSGPGGDLVGALRDVRLYARALAPREITRLAHQASSHQSLYSK